MITVRYIGPGSAILGGTYIYQGETRTISEAQLDAARQHHPQGFAIVGGETPNSIAPLPASVPGEAAPPDEVFEGSESLPVIAPAASEPSTEVSEGDEPPVIAPAAIEAPEQEQPNEQQPGRAIQPAPERRGGHERRAHGKPIRPGR